VLSWDESKKELFIEEYSEKKSSDHLREKIKKENKKCLKIRYDKYNINIEKRIKKRGIS
jgi:hypothetical protein